MTRTLMLETIAAAARRRPLSRWPPRRRWPPRPRRPTTRRASSPACRRRADSPLAPLTSDAAGSSMPSFFDAPSASSSSASSRRFAPGRHRNSDRSARRRCSTCSAGRTSSTPTRSFPTPRPTCWPALEPVGDSPRPDRACRADSLERHAADTSSARSASMLSYSFFITNNMRIAAARRPVNGTMPILYVFLARSGKTIHDVSLVDLDDDGNVQPGRRAGGASNATRGREDHSSPAPTASEQTLYYFSTNLANDGVTSSGFLKFCDKLGAGRQLHQERVLPAALRRASRRCAISCSTTAPRSCRTTAASRSPISTRRNGSCSRSAAIVGADRDLPRPLPAANLRSCSARAAPIDFGIGYRWHPNESNLLVAVRTQVDSATEASAQPAQEGQGSESGASQTAAPERRSGARQWRSRQTYGSPLEWFRFRR